MALRVLHFSRWSLFASHVPDEISLAFEQIFLNLCARAGGCFPSRQVQQ